MRKGAFVILLLVNSLYLLAQNTDTAKLANSNNPPRRCITISTDLLQYAIFQPDIDVSMKVDKIAYGINFGAIFPDPNFSVNILALGQYKWPGMVYDGMGVKFYVKYYHNKDKPRKYWTFQSVFKYLWYNNVQFVDMPDGDIPFRYTMDEKAYTLGLEALHGSEWRTSPHVHAEFFYGFGWHVKLRNFNVIYSQAYGSEGYMPLGSWSGYITYPVFILGLKLGFNFTMKSPG